MYFAFLMFSIISLNIFIIPHFRSLSDTAIICVIFNCLFVDFSSNFGWLFFLIFTLIKCHIRWVIHCWVPKFVVFLYKVLGFCQAVMLIFFSLIHSRHILKLVWPWYCQVNSVTCLICSPFVIYLECSYSQWYFSTTAGVNSLSIFVNCSFRRFPLIVISLKFLMSSHPAHVQVGIHAEMQGKVFCSLPLNA